MILAPPTVPVGSRSVCWRSGEGATDRLTTFSDQGAQLGPESSARVGFGVFLGGYAIHLGSHELRSPPKPNDADRRD